MTDVKYHWQCIKNLATLLDTIGEVEASVVDTCSRDRLLLEIPPCRRFRAHLLSRERPYRQAAPPHQGNRAFQRFQVSLEVQDCPALLRIHVDRAGLARGLLAQQTDRSHLLDPADQAIQETPCHQVALQVQLHHSFRVFRALQDSPLVRVGQVGLQDLVGPVDQQDIGCIRLLDCSCR